MSLLDRINADLKKAMLAKDVVTRDTLRMVKSELTTLNNPDELAVLARAVKSRRESAKSYQDGGRADLAEREEAEIAVIERYLPKQLSEEDAKAAISAIAQELGATQKADMGKLMKAVMDRHRGEIDGKLASKIVGNILSG